MSFIIIEFVILALALSVCGYKNRITYPCILKFAGISIMLFVSLEYVAKTTNYNSFLNTDYELYKWLMENKFRISTLSNLNSIGIAIIIIGTLVYISFLRKITKKSIIIAVFALIIIRFINSQFVGEKLYIYACSFENTQQAARIFAGAVNGLILLIYAAYVGAAYVVAAKAYRETNILDKKRDILFSLIIWFLTDIVIVNIFALSDLRHYTFLSVDLLKYITVYAKINMAGTNVILSSCLILASALLVLYIVPFGAVIKRTTTPEIVEEVNDNFYMMLHTYKNMFCAISMYSNPENAELLGDADMRMERIYKTSSEEVEHIKGILDKLSDSNLIVIKKEYTDLNDCVRTALDRAYKKNDVEVTLSEYADKIPIYADEKNIIEMFVCIINNAMEAFACEQDCCRVDIKVRRENNTAYVDIIDNGEGISRMRRDKIFTRFYSTKKGGSNSGMGLYFARKVAANHMGKISVRSKPHKFTQMQVVLPAGKGDKNG